MTREQRDTETGFDFAAFVPPTALNFCKQKTTAILIGAPIVCRCPPPAYSGAPFRQKLLGSDGLLGVNHIRPGSSLCNIGQWTTAQSCRTGLHDEASAGAAQPGLPFWPNGRT
eukprot:2563056-Amphidinium_carterae.1